MSYLPSYRGLGDAGDVLTEDEERYVSYELPRQQFELDKARFEHNKKMAPWDMLTGIAGGLIPVLTFLGIAGLGRARRGK